MKARYLAFIGTAIAIAISSSSAVAQSSTVPREIKLSQARTGSPPPATQPGSAPSNNQAPAPGAVPPQTQQQAPQTKVSQEELQKFANAVKKLQPIQQQAQTQVAQVIKQQNLSEQRFGEIYQSSRNPQAQPTAKVTPEERKKFAQASTQIQKIQESTQTKMEQAVKGEGLEIPQFNQIFAAIRQNPELLQKVQQMIKTSS